MRDHLAKIVRSAGNTVAKTDGPLTVLDIGCNDGTLLSNYPDGSILFGVDPSDIALSISFPVMLANSVFPSEKARQTIGETKFDVVTSIAMYYDLDDPLEFTRGVADILAEDGIWIVEMSYMPLMLLHNSFDTICHEHLEYYSLSVLDKIFKKAGLKVFKVEINNINGGSIRCYVSHASNIHRGTANDDTLIKRLRMREFEMAP